MVILVLSERMIFVQRKLNFTFYPKTTTYTHKPNVPNTTPCLFLSKFNKTLTPSKYSIIPK